MDVHTDWESHMDASLMEKSREKILSTLNGGSLEDLTPAPPPSPLLLNPHLCHIHCGGRHEHFKTLCLRVKGDFVFLSAQISHIGVLLCEANVINLK